jgi:hypothetical protein
MGRARLFTCGTAALVTAAALALPAVAPAESRCAASRAAGTKVVFASNKAVVYKRRETKPGDGKQWLHYGCLYARDREWPLSGGFAEFSQDFGPWALAGRYVAFGYEYEEAAPDVAYEQIYVFDLRSGKQKYRVPTPTEGSPRGESYVHAIVLKRNGSSAWIPSYHDEYPHVLFQVWEVEMGRDGKRRKLDEGDSIRPHSLALSGNGKTVYWRKGSEARSAKLR